MKSEIKRSGNRLQITRVFDTPRESVFRWWSQAETLQQLQVPLQGGLPESTSPVTVSG